MVLFFCVEPHLTIFNALLPSAMWLRQGNVLHLSVILFTGEGVWETPPWADPPNRHPPPEQTPPWQTTCPPPEMATAADGTHPTGMHSC